MNHRKTWLGLLVLALATVSLGFGARSQADPGWPGPPPQYRATEVSDAVLFNDGPAAYRLVNLKRPPTRWTTALRYAQGALNSELTRRDTWSDTMIVQRIQSGNPVAVREGLVTLVALAREVFDKTFGKETVDSAVLVVDDALLQNAYEVVRADSYIDLDEDKPTLLEAGTVRALFGAAFSGWSWDMAGTPAPQAKLVQDELIASITRDLRYK
ncbi:hypothetical protein [Micromonospora parathelypteridis]|uniref:Uncharacterized protein n=1 Tax=Micromonospora parathelypteridis TaxID=1839617 RepID=A0A840W3Z9_9ACTN|nr:hypothetical protein [Micromonospora parathelypteridis]MBB5480764.1 hypothetical protein [Micromonospora parathelypteridis]GGO21738.1 hypothetical protein GCM10011576_40370 [Micromonospora parathelypteridis]